MRGIKLKIDVIKENEIITSKWAGGESRQYFIYPHDSNYAKRNFLFRVSLAVSNSDEEAEYSDLENYTRHLIMLEGKAHVFHNKHHDIIMNPYKEIDVFDGGWKSSATGKVTDFNLIISHICKGSMSVISKSCDVVINSTIENKKSWLMFFCGIGSALIKLSDTERIEISKGDLLIIEDVEQDNIINIQAENSKLIKMCVNC
jgi:environmental stress-induced protein Ves